MARTQGTGRKKIEIKKIENKLHLKTTFTKRRKGLFKKVANFCTNSSTKAAAFTFSPYGRAYAVGIPSEIVVIEGFYAAQDSISNDDAHSATSQQESGEVCEELDGGGWWWEKPAEELDMCEIGEFLECLSELKTCLNGRIEELQRRRQAVLNLFV